MLPTMNEALRNLAMAYRDTSEPSFEDVLADPIIKQLMQSDNVEPEYIERLNEHVAAMRARLKLLSSQ